MPTVLTGAASYSSTVNGPSAGEVATSAAMRASLQTLIDNDASFAASIGTGGTGVKLIRTFASIAAMKALAGAVNGEVAITTIAAGFPALFRRNTAGTGVDTPFYYDHDTEAGGWDLVRPTKALFDMARYQSIAAWGTTIVSTTSTAWVDATGITLSIPSVLANDTVIITATLTLERADAAQTAFGRLAVTENGGADIVIDVSERRVGMDANDTQFRTDFSVHSQHQVTTSGTFIAKAQYKTSNAASTAAFKAPGTLTAVVYRT